MVQFLCYPSPWPFAPGYLPADPDTPAEDLHNGHAHWAGTSTVERPPVMGDGGGNKMCSSRTMKLYGPRATNMIKYDQIWSNMIKYDQIWSNMIKYVNIEIWSELDKSDNLDMVPDSNGHHRSWENIPAKGLYYVVFTGAKLIQLTTKVIWPVEYCAWTPGVGSRVF